MKKVLLLLLLYSPVALGQSAAQLQAQLGNSKKEKRMWGATFVNTTSSTVRELSAYDSNISNTMMGMLRYKFDGFNGRAFLSGSKDLNGTRQDRFTTAFLELSTVVKPWSGSGLTTLFQGRVHPAVNDERRYNESHRGAASAGLLFIGSPPSPKFQLIGIARVTKNFHEFEINRQGTLNTSVMGMNYFAVSYFPFGQWELSANVTNIFQWDYQGETKETQTFLGQSIGYNYSRNLIITVGHEIGSRTFGYDQNNLDLALFDEDASSVFASFTINY